MRLHRLDTADGAAARPVDPRPAGRAGRRPRRWPSARSPTCRRPRASCAAQRPGDRRACRPTRRCGAPTCPTSSSRWSWPAAPGWHSAGDLAGIDAIVADEFADLADAGDFRLGSGYLSILRAQAARLRGRTGEALRTSLQACAVLATSRIFAGLAHAERAQAHALRGEADEAARGDGRRRRAPTRPTMAILYPWREQARGGGARGRRRRRPARDRDAAAARLAAARRRVRRPRAARAARPGPARPGDDADRLAGRRVAGPDRRGPARRAGRGASTARCRGSWSTHARASASAPAPTCCSPPTRSPRSASSCTRPRPPPARSAGCARPGRRSTRSASRRLAELLDRCDDAAHAGAGRRPAGADRPGAADRPARRGRRAQQGDRRPALPLDPHRRKPPPAGLRQARRDRARRSWPPRCGCCPTVPTLELALG